MGAEEDGEGEAEVEVARLGSGWADEDLLEVVLVAAATSCCDGSSSLSMFVSVVGTKKSLGPEMLERTDEGSRSRDPGTLIVAGDVAEEGNGEILGNGVVAQLQIVRVAEMRRCNGDPGAKDLGVRGL